MKGLHKNVTLIDNTDWIMKKLRSLCIVTLFSNNQSLLECPPISMAAFRRKEIIYSSDICSECLFI